MKTIVPRPYQLLDCADLLAHVVESRHGAAIYCTGAGKTVLALMLATRAMRVPDGQDPIFSHVVITAPTKVIRDAFVSVCVSDSSGSYETPGVDDEDDLPAGLCTYLSLWRPMRIVRLTHSKLVARRSELLALRAADPAFAAGKLLVIDEAHRGGERRKLARLRSLWLSAGGSVLDLTATPDRSDRTIAIDADVLLDRSVSRSMTDQMSDGYAPEKLLSDVIWVSGEARSDSSTLFEPVEPVAVAGNIIRHMEADGWPKAIVRLKSAGSTALHRNVISAVAGALADRGQRVFVASDVHQSSEAIRRLNQQTIDSIRRVTRWHRRGDLSEVLAYESTVQTLRDSCVDVIIGMNTVLEGMDWEVCSHVYFVGVPRYLLPFVQGTGRAMRSKERFESYPGPWRTQSKVVLLAAGAKEKLPEAHRMQMLSLACYLASFRQWDVVGSIRDVLEGVRFATPEDGERMRRLIRSATSVSERKSALIHEARARMEVVASRIRMEGRPITLRQVAGMIKVFIDERLVAIANEEDAAEYASITEREIEHVLLLSRPDAREPFAEEVRRRVAAGVEVTEAVRQSVESVARQFSTEPDRPTEATGVVSDVVQALALDAETMRSCDVQVGAILAGPPDPEPIRRRRDVGPIGRAIEELRR